MPKHNKIIPDYIVYGPVLTDDIKKGSDQIEGCGGCLVIALLIEKLNSLGYFTDYIGFDDKILRDKYGKYIENGDIVVIYTESIIKNPLRAIKIVRWILYFVNKELINKWEKEGNLIFFYWDNFCDKNSNKHFLNIMDIGINKFKNYGFKRQGYCFRVGKGKDYHDDLTYHHISNMQSTLTKFKIEKEHKKLNDHLTRSQMNEIFNHYKLFISYDCESAISVIASLCGCISVIVPKNGLKKENILPCFKYGVAYGIEDIQFAISTRHYITNYYESLYAWGEKTIHDFIKMTLDEESWK